MIYHITTLETVIALPTLLVEMIFIDFQWCIQRDIQILEHELVTHGYDQSSSSSSIAYWGFGYYQYGVNPEQSSKPHFPDYGSSSQSSQPTYSSYEQLFQPYPHYGNCHSNLYTRHRTDDDDDFEPLRHSTWNWLSLVIQHGIDYCIVCLLVKMLS